MAILKIGLLGQNKQNNGKTVHIYFVLSEYLVREKKIDALFGLVSCLEISIKGKLNSLK